MTYVLVAIGAAVGAPLRYLTDRAVQSRHDSVFPWGTFSVNIVGSLILGACAGAASAVPEPIFALVGTGFCGALTTYSTFSYETLALFDGGAKLYAGANIMASMATGVIAAATGAIFTEWAWG